MASSGKQVASCVEMTREYLKKDGGMPRDEKPTTVFEDIGKYPVSYFMGLESCIYSPS